MFGKKSSAVWNAARLRSEVRARKPATAPSPVGIDAVRFDFLDSRMYGLVVAGCDTVFLLRPPAISNTKRTLNIFLDVARTHAVSQVVFVSVAGAADNPLVPHYAVEQHLRLQGREDLPSSGLASSPRISAMCIITTSGAHTIASSSLLAWVELRLLMCAMSPKSRSTRSPTQRHIAARRTHLPDR